MVSQMRYSKAASAAEFLIRNNVAVQKAASLFLSDQWSLRAGRGPSRH